MLSDSLILKKIERQPRQAAGFKQLVRELGVGGDERRELARRLEHLCQRGQLVELDSGLYALPKAPSAANLVRGKLSLHRDGFGFVILDPAASKALQSRISGDVFIPPDKVGSAMHGDRVLVEILRVAANGRGEGRIVRPLDRAHPTVVGIFHRGRQHHLVTPIDQKISREIVIPFGFEYPEPAEGAAKAAEPVDGKQKKRQARHRVLGEEVRNWAEWGELENLVVDVEITDWPTPWERARGRVIEILGREDDFGVDVEIMIRKYHLPHRFPAEVLREAEEIDPAIGRAEARGRRDFRHLPIVTIDGESARDFDDAVYVRRLESGNFELQVHVADVAHYVQPGSRLDGEARLRGTSVYFPDRAVPMLPIELSTDICSLRPNQERLVMSCVMEIDHRGEVLRYEICPGRICSAQRMTYTAVNQILEGDPPARQRYQDLVATFELMRDLAMILMRRRERRGSIDFDLPEPVIEFDEFGLMKSIARSERNIAHRIIEEFMLAANESVAGYLESKGVASLYRIHEKPDAKRVYDFEVIAATFGYSLGVGPLPIERVQFKSDRRASYGTGKRPRAIEIPREVHITPRMYQRLTAKIAGKPEERILSYLMLRSLKQARYSELNLGHFALAATTYTHFTSPIRRYPDLVLHRTLKDTLQQSAERWDKEVPVGVFPRPSAPARSEAAASERGESVAGLAAHTDRRQHSPAAPWSRRSTREAAQTTTNPAILEELHAIAEESSQAERRADDAERELLEWKKVKFMQQHVGEDFEGLVTSVTKYGFFVELTDLFVEGLVPLHTLMDDYYTYRENTREIIGQRSRNTYRLGQRVRVLVDRIDPVEKKIQFAVLAPAGGGRRARERKKPR
jgi:ribonuclease R